jgi:RNA polymerase sigma-70 factor (ECF subfamily)
MPEDVLYSGDEDLAAIIARRAESVQAMNAAHAAMETLYHRHTRPLRSFLAARVIPQADAEDLQQIVWHQVWNHLPDSFNGSNFRAWLYRIARNAAIDDSRRWRPEVRDDLETRPDPRGHSPEAGLAEQARRAALQRCLDKLDPQVVIIVKARLAGAGNAVICQQLSLTPGRAHKLYHKAKKQLQTCVERALS